MFEDDFEVLDEIEEMQLKEKKSMKSILNKSKLNKFEMDEVFLNV